MLPLRISREVRDTVPILLLETQKGLEQVTWMVGRRVGFLTRRRCTCSCFRAEWFGGKVGGGVRIQMYSGITDTQSGSGSNNMAFYLLC